jgi:membrane-associated phospholipid phosphatase
MRPNSPFLAWPGWPVLAEAVVLGMAQTLWWVFVYFGADWVTGLRIERVRIHLDAERNIPFVAGFIFPYRSLDLLFLIAPFVLRARDEIRALALALFVVTGIAGICFLVLPAEPAYVPHPVHGFWSPVFAFNRQIVRNYNMVPSLHVALSTTALAAYGACRGVWGRGLLAGWGGLIALSTLLTHQHHVLDVVTGFLLGWAGYRLVYQRFLHAITGQNDQASPSSNPAPWV